MFFVYIKCGFRCVLVVLLGVGGVGELLVCFCCVLVCGVALVEGVVLA